MTKTEVLAVLRFEEKRNIALSKLAAGKDAEELERRAQAMSAAALLLDGGDGHGRSQV